MVSAKVEPLNSMMPSTLSFVLLVALSLSLNSPSDAQNPNGPPTSNQPQKSSPARKKPAIQDQRGTEQMPLVIKGIPSEKTALQIDEEKRDRDTKTALDRDLTRYTGWQASLTFGLMIVAVVQLGLFYWQLLMMRKSLLDAKTSAQAALKTAESIVTAERAYVKISHAPPGISFIPTIGPAVTLRIENFGRTPSRVTDVVLTFKAYPMRTDLPAVPDYSGAREKSAQAFLVPDDFFNVGRTSPFDEARANDFRGAKERLVVLGFVDYIDQFGQRHRAGYARQFNPIMDMWDTYGSDDAFAKRSNLVLVTEPGYNYDRRRLPGEGRDWNEPT